MSLAFSFFFFNDTATTEIYTLSLHDALPILVRQRMYASSPGMYTGRSVGVMPGPTGRTAATRDAIRFGDGASSRVHVDRKSTRLNSSHSQISYAVFCLKKKKKHRTTEALTSE